MKPKRTCSGICENYRATKPAVGGRYKAGHAKCQTCDMWIDYRGARTKDGSPATKNSWGWVCKCCNYRVRRNPRHTKYKTKMRLSDTKINDDVDLTHFNKRRAEMLRDLGKAIAQKEDDESYESLLSNNFKTDIESEFETSIDILVVLAKQIDPPNKVSMIAEFERIKFILGHTPTKDEIGEHSEIDLVQYEAEFKSWKHFLSRLDYDPWYRENINSKTKHAEHSDSYDVRPSGSEIKNDDVEQLAGHEIKKKMNELRKWLLKYYEKLDLEQNNSEYSYKDEFDKLEKYFTLLPKHAKHSIFINL